MCLTFFNVRLNCFTCSVISNGKVWFFFQVQNEGSKCVVCFLVKDILTSNHLEYHMYVCTCSTASVLLACQNELGIIFAYIRRKITLNIFSVWLGEVTRWKFIKMSLKKLTPSVFIKRIPLFRICLNGLNISVWWLFDQPKTAHMKFSDMWSEIY